MTRVEARKLAHGLYKIHWKRGGTSLASVGSRFDGNRWFMPTNWVSAETSLDWRLIDRVHLITVEAN